MTIYFDKNGFHERLEDTLPEHYETTQEERIRVIQELNEKAKTNKNDVWRIVPDIDGKPIVTEIELDYVKIYRRQRESECFPIINRGQAWYNSLTESQESELQEWYQAWLDVTETLVVPERPGWLI